MSNPASNLPAAVDRAFTAPENPEFFTLNAPAAGEVIALLTNRERLTAFLVGGFRLWHRAVSRTWDGPVQWADDPSFGQKSNVLARQEWLTHYQWLHLYGPTLLQLVDQGVLGGAAEREADEQQG